MSPDIAEWFKNAAPVATLVSTLAALLVDRFRVVPARLGRHVFWYGALAFYAVWISNVFISHPASRSWATASWVERSVLIVLVLCSVAAVIFVVIHTGLYRRLRKVPSQHTVAHESPGDTVLFSTGMPDSSQEFIDGYWKFSDFAVFRTDRFVNSRTKATTTLRLVGGSVLLDTALYNLSEDSILLDELECVTKSDQPAHVFGAGPGALPISGVYRVFATIDNERVKCPMEPRLHVPGKDTVRFIILFVADMTGCVNPHFTFKIIIRGGNKPLSELGPFQLSFNQLTQSFSETRTLLERRNAINPDDVATLTRYGLALEATYDKMATEVFSHVLNLDSANAEGLGFFIRNHLTQSEEKIALYYKLETLNPQAATGSSAHVVGPLLERAEEAWGQGDVNAFQGILKEARRLAVKSGHDYCLKDVLEREIVLSIYEGNIEAATEKARSWERTKHLFTVWPPEAPRNALVDRLKEALPGKWTAEIERAIREAIMPAADAA